MTIHTRPVFAPHHSSRAEHGKGQAAVARATPSISPSHLSMGDNVPCARHRHEVQESTSLTARFRVGFPFYFGLSNHLLVLTRARIFQPGLHIASKTRATGASEEERRQTRYRTDMSVGIPTRSCHATRGSAPRYTPRFGPTRVPGCLTCGGGTFQAHFAR